jgi:fatty-acyl-CoA synthase
MLDGLAEIHAESPALLGEGETFSYATLAIRANQIARWAHAEQIEAAALFMPNGTEYVAIWLGLTRAGAVTALINTNLVGEALAHCIRAAGATHIITTPSLRPALGETEARILETLPLDGIPGHRIPPSEIPFPAQNGRALLVYTSGTTGMPKAGIITHARILEWGLWFAAMMDVQSADRMYDCLPLYHATGGIVAIAAMLTKGGSVLIRPRFSASRFWDEVADGGCTIFQYIGELCRYLASSPPHPRERAHRLRLACGNGMQGDVWRIVQRRFGLPQVLEFYAATEGVVSLYNVEGKPGAIGRIPPFMANRFPVALVRCDPESGEIARDADGLCIPCAPGETGEALGAIQPHARPFDGYTDASASAKKLIANVLAPGDHWFRTGDLMQRDAEGYFSFIDRIGDTFRWKGENVATTEVALVLRGCPGVRDAVVYGVAVPGHEGRAGMAALTTGPEFSLEALQATLAAGLPGYAQPLFVRLCTELDITGTFKLPKARLAAAGYAGITGPVWFNDHGRLIPCDAQLIAAINDGKRRL